LCREPDTRDISKGQDNTEPTIPREKGGTSEEEWGSRENRDDIPRKARGSDDPGGIGGGGRMSNKGQERGKEGQNYSE